MYTFVLSYTIVFAIRTVRVFVQAHHATFLFSGLKKRMRKEKRSWYSRTYDHAASAAKAQPRRKKSAGASKPATSFVRVHAPNDSRVVTRHAALVGRHLENRT